MQRSVKFVIGLFVILSAVLGAEMISRVFFPYHSDLESVMLGKNIYTSPKPYVMFGGRPNTMALNGLGYKGPLPKTPKDPNEYRIIMLGGLGSTRGKPPISVLLQNEFAQNGFDAVRVYDFSVAQSVSGMELARIVFEIADLDPDLILMYNGGNDLLMPYYFDPRPGYPHNFSAYENNPLLGKDIATYPALTLLLYGSNLARHLFADHFQERFLRIQTLRRQAGYLSEQWGTRIARTYVRHILRAHQVARAFGADCQIFFQPMLYFKTPLSPEEKKVYPNTSKYFVTLRNLILREAQKQQAAGRLNFFDLNTVFKGTAEPCFNGPLILRQEVKPRVAKEMFKQLAKTFRF